MRWDLALYLHIYYHHLLQWACVLCEVQPDFLIHPRLYNLFETPSKWVEEVHFYVSASVYAVHPSRALPNYVCTSDCAGIRGFILLDGPLAHCGEPGFPQCRHLLKYAPAYHAGSMQRVLLLVLLLLCHLSQALSSWYVS